MWEAIDLSPEGLFDLKVRTIMTRYILKYTVYFELRYTLKNQFQLGKLKFKKITGSTFNSSNRLESGLITWILESSDMFKIVSKN